jgi:uncharacterized membrane protein YbhN (UPF0104 family)
MSGKIMINKNSLFNKNVFFSAMISGMLLFYIFQIYLDYKNLLFHLKNVSLFLLVLSDLPYFIQTSLYAYRLQIGFRASGHSLSYGKAFWSHLFGMLCSNFGLGKLGYYAACYPLHEKINYSFSMGVITSIQSLDMIVKAIGALIGGIFFINYLTTFQLRLITFSLSIGFIVAGGVLLVLMWSNDDILPIKIEHIPIFGVYLARFKEASKTIKPVQTDIILIAVIGWVLRGFEWYLLSLATNLGLSFSTCFLLHPLLTIIRMVPFTFNGVGLLEFVLISVFPSISPEKLVVFGMLDFMNNLLVEIFAITILINRK